MKKIETAQPEKEVELTGILEEFRQALREEIDQIKKDGQSSTLLYGGREVKHNQDNYWYEFSVEYAPSIPADTPCRLILGKEYFEVDVIGFEGNTITLASKAKLNPPFAKARLENGSTVLMESLIKCIEANADVENPAGNRMLPVKNGKCEDFKKIYSYDIEKVKGETKAQYAAVVSALTNNISYIWGPPGTGKTTVIGRIIEQLYDRNRSVLVVSHTNTAVDGAIKKAVKFCDYTEGKPFPVLRIGKQNPNQNWPKGVSMREHVSLLGEELYKKKKTLQHIEESLRKQLSDNTIKLAKITWVKDSQLQYADERVKRIQASESKLRSLQKNAETIEHDAEIEKENHPEVKRFYKLTSSLKEKTPELTANEEHIEALKESIDRYTAIIFEAEDEIKKHTVYSALAEKASKMMSEHFLNEQIEITDSKIHELENELTAADKLKQDAVDFLKAYEKKSSFSKFFINKDSVARAEAQVEEANKNISEIKENIQRQLNLKADYKHQLEEVLLIQDQMRATTPSHTAEYWQKIKKENIEKKSTVDKMLRDTEATYQPLKSEVEELKKAVNNAKTSMDSLRRLKEKLRQVESEVKSTQAELNSLKNALNEMLENECRLCSEFFSTDQEFDAGNLIKVLRNKFNEIEKEAAAYNYEQLQNDVNNLRENLNNVFKQLAEVEEQIQELEKQAILNAKIVGATLTKTYLSDALRMRTFDTVILDEASMASIPALWCASYLAKNNVVIVGDFLQLPPIVMSDKPYAKKWLGQDIFYHSGIQEKAKNANSKPSNFIMLNDQFRMDAKIADIANMYYGEYGGLKSDISESSEERKKNKKVFDSWYYGSPKEKSIRLIDTESLHAWVSGIVQGRGHSRLNCFSAAVDVDLAFKCIEKKLAMIDRDSNERSKDPAVLIVAPYKPHINLINKLIESAYERRGFKTNPNLIQAGTIHSFQGSEADIVIFDLVIDEPHWRANLFMKEKEVNDDLRKMFNVAVTRAKFKLFVVGNFAYCEKKAKDNALAQLLNQLTKVQKLKKENAKDLLPNLVFAPPTNTIEKIDFNKYDILCNEGNFYPYLIEDIKKLRHNGTLIIYSPFITENRLEILIPYLSDAINRNCNIIVVTKAASERGKSEITQYKKCEKELEKIGVQVIHKQGMHEKIIFIDKSAVWTGSLNALSSTGNTGEIMERRTGDKVIEEYKKILDVDHLVGANLNKQELHCPICGGEMLIKESDNGGFYWQCISGDYSRNAEQPYPCDGEIRCKCGAKYKFLMKTVPRWQCTENPKHYQNIRRADLKLEKMRALIPSKRELRAVEKYFDEKSRSNKTKTETGSKKTDDENVGGEQLSLF